MDKEFFKLLDPTNVSTYLKDCEILVKKSVPTAKRETDPQVLHQCGRCERWVRDDELLTEGICNECSFPLFI
jgi:DNA-directed RNA polymerase subunit RPC12/RpoP